ncbi:outer membrane beta-barrel protein [Hirschia litorea]|uniref:Outer membrane beta-barrel protein n=1 Tax=Hirschia litorea TaxID=1199156 RepID=A0ABW2INX0_9PROT
MGSLISRVVLGASIGVGLVSPAFAQDQQKNVSVKQRPKPEFAPNGVPMGAFRAYPTLDISAQYDSNTFITETNELEDFVATIAPAINIQSNWSNHSLSTNIGGLFNQYAEETDLNTNTFYANSNGQLDIDSGLYFTGGAGYRDSAESLANAPLPNLAEPIKTNSTDVNIGFVKGINRVQLAGRASWARNEYGDAVTKNGTEVSQSARDNDITNLEFRTEYEISPDTSFFVNLKGNGRAYPSVNETIGDLNRDSQGYEVLLGSKFDISNLMRGEIGIGYLNQDYDAVAGGNASGLAFNAGVEWFADQLITVNFDASRGIQDAAVSNAFGYLASNIGVSVDYEFRRNIIISAGTDYALDDYQDLDRQDSRWGVTFGSEYLLNKNVALFTDISRRSQSSDGLNRGKDFDINQVSFGLRLRR